MPVEVGQGVHLRATKNIVDDTATARIPGEEYVALWPRCGVGEGGSEMDVVGCNTPIDWFSH